MLAEYGGLEWADEGAQLQLASSWARRKKFEARLIAKELAQLFAGSGEGGSGKVPGHELLSMAGISL